MANSYYFARNGNDNNKGNAPDSAWANLSKLEHISLNAGDIVFLKSGNIFEGSVLIKQSGSPENPIQIKTYGGTENAIMKGSVGITPKEKYQKGFRYKSSKKVKDVFIDNHWLQLARYPSKGFFGIDGGSKKTLTDRELLLNPVDCTGADVRIRAVNWQYEIARVKEHVDDKLIFENNMIYQCNKDYGYFLDNKLEFMSDPGEWYYDDKNQWLYFNPLNENEISKSKVETVLFDTGVNISSGSHIHIKNITFERYLLAGININTDSSEINIENCSFREIHRDGINLNAGTLNVNIQNCSFSHIKGRGIACLDAEKANIKNNHLANIGHYPGYGFDGVNNGTAIAILKTELVYQINNTAHKHLSELLPLDVTTKLKDLIEVPFADEKFLITALEERLGKEKAAQHTPAIIETVKKELAAFTYDSNANYVGYNLIENIGLHGIRLDGKNCVCEYNIVKDTLQYMNDAGAIYSWAQTYDYSINSIIRKNIVINVKGNVIATPDFHRFAHGIYLDNKCVGFTLEDNIVTGATWGILANDESRQQTITGNIVFDNEVGLAFSEYFMPGTLYGCKAENNILFAKKRHQRAFLIESRISPAFSPVVTDNNFYGHSYYTFPIVRMTFKEGHRNWEEHTLESWQKATGYDKGSLYYAPADPEHRPRMSDIIINDTLEKKEFIIDNTLRDHYTIYDEKLGDKVMLEPFSAMIILED